MSDDFHRAKLSAAERNFRSEAARLTLNRWFLRGSLSERLGKRGKPNSRCTRGPLHKSLSLVQSQAGKLPQNSFPQSLQEPVRGGVDAYHKMKELIEEVSELE